MRCSMSLHSTHLYFGAPSSNCSCRPQSCRRQRLTDSVRCCRCLHRHSESLAPDASGACGTRRFAETVHFKLSSASAAAPTTVAADSLSSRSLTWILRPVASAVPPLTRSRVTTHSLRQYTHISNTNTALHSQFSQAAHRSARSAPLRHAAAATRAVAAVQ